MMVSPAKPDGAPKVIFAALELRIAAEMEPRFAEAGRAVITNSSALRMAEGCSSRHSGSQSRPHQADRVPVVERKNGGFVVTNPNCSAIGLVLALDPLHRALRTRNGYGGDYAGRKRRRISRRGLARHSGQRYSLHPQ